MSIFDFFFRRNNFEKKNKRIIEIFPNHRRNIYVFDHGISTIINQIKILLAKNNKEYINLLINSDGENAKECIALTDYLLKLKKKSILIRTVIICHADSFMIPVYLAGSERCMMSGSSISFNNSSEVYYDYIKKVTNSLLKIDLYCKNQRTFKTLALSFMGLVDRIY